MKKNIFAVCDLEVDYALNFMDYLNQKKNIPFEIQAFTAVENLISYGKKNTYRVAVDFRTGYVPGGSGIRYRENHYTFGGSTSSGA